MLDQLRSLGRTELMIGGGVIAALIVLAILLSMGGSGKKTDRDEVLANVDRIRTAQIQYKDAFGDYISADPSPRKPHEVNEVAVPWKASSGFELLAWAPEVPEEVLGTYWIQADKKGFTVHGACDADGDGERATVVASQDKPAQLTSAETVY